MSRCSTVSQLQRDRYRIFHLCYSTSHSIMSTNDNQRLASHSALRCPMPRSIGYLTAVKG